MMGFAKKGYKEVLKADAQIYHFLIIFMIRNYCNMVICLKDTGRNRLELKLISQKVRRYENCTLGQNVNISNNEKSRIMLNSE